MFARRLLLRTTTNRLLANPNLARFAGALAAQSAQSKPPHSDPIERIKTCNDAPSIHSLYPSVIKSLENATHPPPRFTVDDAKAIVAKLVASGRAEDMQRIQNIVCDLLPRLGIPPSLDLHTIVGEHYVRQNDFDSLADWASRLHKLPGNFTLSTEWLNRCLERLQFPTAANAMAFTNHVFKRSLGHRANSATLRILCNHLANAHQRSPLLPFELPLIPKAFETCRVGWNPDLAQYILQRFTQIGDEKLGRHLHTLYRSLYTSSRWAVDLEQFRRQNDFPTTLAYLKTKITNNEIPPTSHSKVAKIIMDDSVSLSDLLLADKELGPAGATRRWACVIKNLSTGRDLEETLKIYRAALAHNVPLDNALVSPILSQIFFQRPQGLDHHIQTALEIYRDLMASTGNKFVEDPDMLHRVLDWDVYTSIFRVIETAPNIHHYSEIVKSLLDDMSRAKVPIHTRLAQALTYVQIRLAATADEAMQAYNHYKHFFTTSGYVRALEAFVRRPFVVHSVPQYFTIVKDMQRTGYPKSNRLYTILLFQIGTIATALKREAIKNPEYHEMLLDATRRAHDHLTLDPTITPSPVTLSQLLNTYQRLGCFGDAVRVWESMYLSGRFTSRTVSNILDGCGYAGDIFTANSVWQKLRADHYQLDAKAWETYIECLARIGKIDTALRVLLMDMPASGFDQLHAARVLVKLARKHKCARNVYSALETDNPGLYHRVRLANRMDYPVHH